MTSNRLCTSCGDIIKKDKPLLYEEKEKCRDCYNELSTGEISTSVNNMLVNLHNKGLKAKELHEKRPPHIKEKMGKTTGG